MGWWGVAGCFSFSHFFFSDLRYYFLQFSSVSACLASRGSDRREASRRGGGDRTFVYSGAQSTTPRGAQTPTPGGGRRGAAARSRARRGRRGASCLPLAPSPPTRPRGALGESAGFVLQGCFSNPGVSSRRPGLGDRPGRTGRSAVPGPPSARAHLRAEPPGVLHPGEARRGEEAPLLPEHTDPLAPRSSGLLWGPLSCHGSLTFPGGPRGQEQSLQRQPCLSLYYPQLS